MAAPYICQVLVVGAGPAGLAGAIELKRRGISLKIIDSKTAPTETSNAVGINARSLELLEPCGATEQLIAAGTRITRVNQYYQGKRLGSVNFSLLKHRFNFLLALPQYKTEHILADVLQQQGVAVARGATLTTIEKTAQGVLATAERTNDDALQYNSGLILGADGHYSKVRELAKIEFDGRRYHDNWSLADVELDWDLPYDEGHLFMREEGPIFFAIAIGDGRHRIISNTANVVDLTPPPYKIKTVHWSTDFNISLRQVKAYQQGLLYLAGDAAHVHSPAGGRGMNLGIEDACSFARRIVEGGLESYSKDRHPIGASVLKDTDRLFRGASARNPVKRGLRNFMIRMLFNRPSIQSRFAWRMSGLQYPFK